MDQWAERATARLAAPAKLRVFRAPERLGAKLLAPRMGAPAADARVIEEYVKKAFRKAAWSLAGLFVVVVVIGAVFERELMQVAEWTERSVGVAGLGAVVFLTDTFTLPFPPDLALLVVANSARRVDWYWIVPLLGCMSVLGGCLGWCIGTRLSRLSWVSRLNAALQQRQSALFARYGALTVAIGALTPVPFSVTCWAAGALGMPFRTFIAPCLLRIPRFVAYYLILAKALSGSEWLSRLLL
jgi:membrane protein YqaA with SNARE-associated domain